MLIFLKLGGSLITNKDRSYTHRPGILDRIVDEIVSGLSKNPGTQLLLGHGSGSFGHVAAEKTGTRNGVRTERDWRGFAEVRYRAAQLNHLVMEAIQRKHLPAVAFPASAAVISDRGEVRRWDLGPIHSALQAGLMPVVYGDVVFDDTLGGTILSTEDQFVYLARHLHPAQILLAGLEPGVWSGYPDRTEIVPELNSQNFSELSTNILGSASTDVTGGMLAKVEQMLALCQELEPLQVFIFSGASPGAMEEALTGTPSGTVITR